MKQKLKLIGVAGTAGAGKDAVTEILAKLFGLKNLSTSNMGRAITRQVFHLPADFNPVHDQLYIVANYVRNEVHPAAYVKLCLLEAEVQKLPGGIISGLRSMGEAEAVREAGGIIIGVDADPRIRYRRIFDRARDAESKKTLEEFLKQDEFENHGVSDSGPGRGIRSIIDSADLVIANAGTLEELELELRTSVPPLLLQ